MKRTGVFNVDRLKSIIAISEKNFQLNFSESYPANLHDCDSVIEGYLYSIYGYEYGF